MIMKKLWKRALGMIKDRNSLCLAKMFRKSRHHNPSLESAIIKATSHDDRFIDYKNAQRVFTWVRTSPSVLIIFLRALTRRVEHTKDWAVALKCLMLFHGVLCTKAAGTRRIGRLPFDLSSFEDFFTRRDPTRLRARNEFVRAYFAFSDAKSVVMAAELKEEREREVVVHEYHEKQEEEDVKVRLIRVARWQNLMDEILQVKPQGNDMLNEVLVVEAMDCMIIEVFELYSKICDGIAKALMMIHTDMVDVEEATLALDVLQKASKQGQELSDYFDFCRKIGILHASECPKIEKIPPEDFVELERIINGGGGAISLSSSSSLPEEEVNATTTLTSSFGEQGVICIDIKKSSALKTVITDKWEVFDEDIIKLENENDHHNEYRKEEKGLMLIDPFASSHEYPPLIQFNPFIDYGGNSQLVVSLS